MKTIQYLLNFHKKISFFLQIELEETDSIIHLSGIPCFSEMFFAEERQIQISQKKSEHILQAV